MEQKASPSKTNSADKAQIISKNTKAAIKAALEQVAPQLLRDFKDSLEASDKNKLDTISVLSASKLEFTKMLFDTYIEIRLDVRSFGISNNNYAKAELEIAELIDKQGEKAIPSDV